MTRKTIIDDIGFEQDISFDSYGGWTTQELQNAMVAAYNRGIEDVLNLELLMPDEVESLKIK